MYIQGNILSYGFKTSDSWCGVGRLETQGTKSNFMNFPRDIQHYFCHLATIISIIYVNFSLVQKGLKDSCIACL